MERTMKWIIWTLVVLVSIVGVVTLVGWLLPVKHEASRSARYSQPPERIYAAVADVAEYPSWSEGVSRVEMLDSPSGRTRFREHMSTGPVVMEVVETTPPNRFVTAIADPDQPFGGTWTFEITPESGGSRLTITERGEIYNPIFRFMARFVFGYAGTMEGFLRSLEKKFAAP
jgi:ribosome-associated toxin RatA of RatAB toxin-antitoxin module